MPIDRFPEQEIAETAATLRTMHAGGTHPDPNFLDRLEHSLFATSGLQFDPRHARIEELARGGRIGSQPIHRFSWNGLATFALIACILLAFVGLARPDRWGDQAETGAIQQNATAELGSLPTGMKWVAPPPAGDDLELGGMAIANGVVYRLVSTSLFKGVQAYRATDGMQLWEVAADWLPAIAADENGVYLGVAAGDLPHQVIRLDPIGGRQNWMVPLTGDALHIVTQNDPESVHARSQGRQSDLVFIQDTANIITAVSASDLSSSWSTSISDTAYDDLTTDPPVVVENTIVAQASDGSFVALSRDTGDIQWHQDVHDGRHFAAIDGIVAIVYDKDPYDAGGTDSALQGLDLLTGEQRWSWGVWGGISLLTAGFTGSTPFFVIWNDNPNHDAKHPQLAGTFRPANPAMNADLLTIGNVLVGVDPQSGKPGWNTETLNEDITSIFTRVPNSGQIVVTNELGYTAVVNAIFDDQTPMELTVVMFKGFTDPVQFDPSVPMAGPPLADRSGVFIQFADGQLMSLDDLHQLSVRG